MGVALDCDGRRRSDSSLVGDCTWASSKSCIPRTRSFDQGLMLHAPAELVYRLEKQYRWLSFSTGVNSEMTEKGSVTVQVC